MGLVRITLGDLGIGQDWLKEWKESVRTHWGAGEGLKNNPAH